MSAQDLLEEERSRLYVEMHPEIRDAAPTWTETIEADYLNDNQPWMVIYSRQLEGGVTLLQGAIHHQDGRLELEPWSVEIRDEGVIRDSEDLRAVLDGLWAAVDLIRREERAKRSHT